MAIADDIEQGRLAATAHIEKAKALRRQVEETQGGRDEASNRCRINFPGLGEVDGFHTCISGDKGPSCNGQGLLAQRANAMRRRPRESCPVCELSRGGSDRVLVEGLWRVVQIASHSANEEGAEIPISIVYEHDDAMNSLVQFFADGSAEAHFTPPSNVSIVRLDRDGHFMFARQRTTDRIILCGSSGVNPSNYHCCSQCGAPPEPGRKLLCCARCVDEGLDPHRYCSKKCQLASWSSHKQWHRAATDRAALASAINKVVCLEGEGATTYSDLCKICPAKLATKAAEAGVTIESLTLRARARHLQTKGKYALAVKVRFTFGPRDAWRRPHDTWRADTLLSLTPRCLCLRFTSS